MKSVLISIQSKWCELIASGKKTVEVRKTRPKLETPFKCYIYCTQGKDILAISRYADKSAFLWKKSDVDRYNIDMVRNGKVIGEFVCNKIDEIGYSPEMHGKYISETENLHEVSCVDFEQMFDYIADGYGYGWHISDLVIYDKPKELEDFRTICKFRNDDGGCQYEKVECDCVRFDFNPDYSLNLAECLNYMSRPPQSWCYVDSIE